MIPSHLITLFTTLASSEDKFNRPCINYYHSTRCRSGIVPAGAILDSLLWYWEAWYVEKPVTAPECDPSFRKFPNVWVSLSEVGAVTGRLVTYDKYESQETNPISMVLDYLGNPGWYCWDSQRVLWFDPSKTLNECSKSPRRFVICFEHVRLCLGSATGSRLITHLYVFGLPRNQIFWHQIADRELLDTVKWCAEL